MLILEVLRSKNRSTKVKVGVDILENEIKEKYPKVLDTLLIDRTTKNNIFWATDNYAHLGEGYSFEAYIMPELITGENGNIIMPRVHKDKALQRARAKQMAEVFTPSWVCNAQNNIVDHVWFGRKNVFNREMTSKDGLQTWITTKEKISFPEGKSWQDYISDTRLEISCGEAPYLVSRYDTTSGVFIPVNERIGILDRKLRIINENANSKEDWLDAAEIAYKNTYAYEWQGDSLLLAREAMLITFIEYFNEKFNDEPKPDSIETIANIISWNAWQMDGLKGVVPNSCQEVMTESKDLFENTLGKVEQCTGCESNKILAHNGTYCLIMDWDRESKITGKKGAPIRFVDLIKK